MRSLLILIVLATVAAADTDAEVTGFVTSGAGDLAGKVTDFDTDKPLSGVKVHIVPNKGGAPRIVTTDREGNYRALRVPGDYSYVYVEAKVKIAGQVGVSIKEDGVEAIEMRETLAPAVQAKALSPAIVPDYSALAEDKNTWTRAWLMLDINEAGVVTRVNLIDKPGLDLDKIAVREAFKLKFEPALDGANRKITSMVLWSFEWPPYFWMMDHRVALHALPKAAASVVCRGTGPATLVRDCSKPTVANAMTQPWFDRTGDGLQSGK